MAGAVGFAQDLENKTDLGGSESAASELDERITDRLI